MNSTFNLGYKWGDYRQSHRKTENTHDTNHQSIASGELQGYVGNLKSEQFYLAEKRTFLLRVDNELCGSGCVLGLRSGASL